jgi:hypothetical protein
MGQLLRVLKAGVLWSYSRTTWQYDVLCALILAFIFLTPQGWVQTGQLQNSGQHQTSSAASQSILDAGEGGAPLDQSDIERRVRVLTGRQDATVIKASPILDAHGKTLGYVVDIR